MKVIESSPTSEVKRDKTKTPVGVLFQTTLCSSGSKRQNSHNSSSKHQNKFVQLLNFVSRSTRTTNVEETGNGYKTLITQF
jgi:hypothetical protein